MIIVRIFASISFCNEFLVVLNWPFFNFFFHDMSIWDCL